MSPEDVRILLQDDLGIREVVKLKESNWIPNYKEKKT